MSCSCLPDFFVLKQRRSEDERGRENKSDGKRTHGLKHAFATNAWHAQALRTNYRTSLTRKPHKSGLHPGALQAAQFLQSLHCVLAQALHLVRINVALALLSSTLLRTRRHWSHGCCLSALRGPNGPWRGATTKLGTTGTVCGSTPATRPCQKCLGPFSTSGRPVLGSVARRFLGPVSRSSGAAARRFSGRSPTRLRLRDATLPHASV